MHHRFVVPSCLLLLAAVPAMAKDRPVTDDERVKLVAAMMSEGCSGGRLEFDDDGRYEVDDATCVDGRKYDLEFDTAFKLVKKELED